ncbi:T9SS type A sorting domain-containing protein [bacterium]|nr:T9SS type A sorting domain-containing protein [bacterium]
MRLKKFVIPCLLTVLLLVSAGIGVARENNNAAVQTQMLKPTGTPVRTLLNINLLAHWMFADGISAHDPNTNGSGVIFPRGTYGAGVIYTDGLVWGGFVQDGSSPELRVGGTTYNTGLQRGAIVSKGVAEDPNAPDVRIWRIRPDYKTADLKRDAAELQDAGLSNITDADVAAVRAQYETDWNEWPWQKGAPFNDANGNGIMDGDETPGFAGADQVIWFTANDLNSSQCFQLAGSPPIGMEVQVTLWGYNRTDALGNVAFKRYRFIYKGTSSTPADATIDSMFVAVFSDPDLGDYSSDYVGCDTTAGLGFVYNSVTQDSKFVPYGLAPPSAGYDFLQGPVVKSDDPNDKAIFMMKEKPGYKNFGMTGFLYFAAGTSISDPDLKVYDGTLQWYNLMNGLLPRAGTPFLDNYGNPTKFPLSGDPVKGDYNIDGVLMSASDRRFGMVTGPINMAVGDTQEVVVALLTGLGADRLSSLSVLKYNDISAQYAFDNLFELAKAPQQPLLKVTNLDNKVLLNWGWDGPGVEATEAEQKGYLFEGYNVYQLPNAAATKEDAKLVATYDVANEITTILDSKFDPVSGQILQLPVQIGKNTGVKRNITITKDAFTDQPLVNGRRYYFAVTAYSYNGDQNVPIHSLESALNTKTAIPQMPDPGYSYSYTVGDTVAAVHYGPSDGSVLVTVVDPTATTGHVYNVKFTEDAENGGYTWSIVDSTLDEVKLSGQTNQSGDDNYLTVDGLQVKVVGPPAGVKAVWETDQDNNVLDNAVTEFGLFDHPSLGTTGYIISNRAGEPNSGRCFDRFGLWGMDDVEYNFAENSLTWDYISEAVHFDAATNEAYIAPFGVHRHLFSTGEDQRLFAGFWDYDETGTWNVDGAHWAGAIFGAPSYEPVYAWVGYDASGNRISYDPANNAQYETDNDLYTSANTTWGSATGPINLPFITATLFTMYLDNATLPIGNKVWFITNKPNTANDVFSFTTEGVNFSKDAAQADVEKINVYPNPYYGINPRETTNVDKFVSFNHLPQKATIYIFNLAGQLVNTIEKDDPSQFCRWNLRNHNDLPVASGIYIIRINMPEIGKVKVLKLSLVQQQQFIEIF